MNDTRDTSGMNDMRDMHDIHMPGRIPEGQTMPDTQDAQDAKAAPHGQTPPGAAKNRPNRPSNTPAPSGRAAARSPRRRAREFAMQGLYQWRLSGNDEAAIEAHLRDSEGFGRADREFFSALLHGVLAQETQLQAQLQEFLDRPFAELSPVEASILLAGAYELGNNPETPYRVIINEAIELTKGFGGADGHKYVNGVLDRLAAKLRPAEVNARRAAGKTGGKVSGKASGKASEKAPDQPGTAERVENAENVKTAADPENDAVNRQP